MKKIICLVFAFFAMASTSNAQTISITGDGASGWGTDVDMMTSDNNIYTLSNFTFSAGGIKFKKDHSWAADKNWGGPVFPSGIAVADGPNITVPAGVYDLTFNLTTKAVQFTAVAQGFSDIFVKGSANGDVAAAMSTTDGINYVLYDADLGLGGLKFQEDLVATSTWGDSAFPSGTAALDGNAMSVTPGTYDIRFNKTTGVYSFTFPQISVVGNAKLGWPNGNSTSNDFYLTTTDGENYSTSLTAFTTGELKFRKNGNWAVSWGGTGFPSGTSSGSNIQVQGGTYVVAFNRITGAYSFSSGYPTISLTKDGVDTDMFTGDGITYTKNNVDVLPGMYKFRQAHANDFVWGGSMFPSGIAKDYVTTFIKVKGGRYNISFNKVTGAYTFVVQKIGIIGDFNGWSNTLPMTTSNGVNYTINGVTLSGNPAGFGNLKFRQGDDWNTSNWGGGSFPSGTANLGGSDIPYSASLYNINFNISTGAYIATDLVRTKLRASFCGETLPALQANISAEMLKTATEYRFKVVVNGGDPQVLETGASRSFKLTSLTAGAMYSTAYTISVSVKIGGTWQPWGAECVVTTPAVPKTKVQTSQCGQTLAALNTNVRADVVFLATEYRFTVTANGATQVIEGGASRFFKLSSLTGGAKYNTAYTVSVDAKYNGNWGGLGDPCVVTTPAAPFTKVRATQCGQTLPALDTTITADNLTFATDYSFKVVVNGDSYEVNPVGNIRSFKLTSLPVPVVAGTSYTISVAAQHDGIWGDYGTECDVTTPGTAPTSRQATEATSIETADFNLVAYPNPSNSIFNLKVNGANDDAVSILVFDMTGRQIENKVVKTNDIENITLGQNYSTGVYNVIVSQGINTKTVRLVKN